MLDEREQLSVVAGLQSGCRDAWTRLYEGYSLEVWRYVARLLGNDAAAVADAVQETFLAAARSARQFDAQRGNLHGWLLGIAHHAVTAHWRQAGRLARLRTLAENSAPEIAHLLDADDSLRQSVQRSETADLVRAALAELSADYAAILIGKYLDDRSLAELATDTTSSVDAVKSKLSRARREFRVKFEKLLRRERAADNVSRAAASEQR